MSKIPVYNFFQKIIPNKIFTKLKRSRVYPYIKKIADKTLGDGYHPDWYVFTAGPLKGRRMYVDPTGDWQKEMLSGNYDAFFVNYINKIKEKIKKVVDVGAHVGFSAMLFAELIGENGVVVTYEPNPVNIQRIKMNLRENPDLEKRITLKEIAVSDKKDEMDLIYADSIENGSSSGSFIENASTIFKKEDYEMKGGFKRIKIKTEPLDELLKSHLIPDLIKIDIEGAEYLALKGAGEILSKYHPLLLIEIHSDFNRQEIQKTLEKFGYNIEILNREKDGRLFIAAHP